MICPGSEYPDSVQYSILGISQAVKIGDNVFLTVNSTLPMLSALFCANQTRNFFQCTRWGRLITLVLESIPIILNCFIIVIIICLWRVK